MVKSSETERKERMDTSSLMKQILSSDNLNRAYLQVVRNKGAEGVDGMKYTELKEHLVKDGEIIKEQLRTRKYKPQPVRRVEIPKPDGGVRNLGVPTVTDRFIQQAIAQVLTPIYEEQFHDHSYGFRPNRCAQQAILTALDHGTSEAVLQAGVGHFWGTSLPVGGESTHTVLTGHRGLPTKTLFTNIDKLEVGDIFYIKVLDETLAYQIDQILTVLPQETDSLSIEPGKDYATLVTCTPFAINTHRLLVRGERIPYEEATKQEPDTNIKPELSFTAKVLIVTIIVIFIGLMIAVIYSIRDRKRRKARCERR